MIRGNGSLTLVGIEVRAHVHAKLRLKGMDMSCALGQGESHQKSQARNLQLIKGKVRTFRAIQFEDLSMAGVPMNKLLQQLKCEDCHFQYPNIYNIKSASHSTAVY